MSRFDDYNNIFDAEDDGEDIEITNEDEAASDDEGREEAATVLGTANSIRGTGKYDEQQRRMFLRWAKKALAQGQERRQEAEAAAKAEAAAEKARAAAEKQAACEQIARAAKQQRHRERFERSMRESDARWERLNEQTRRENAAWEAGREERERREEKAAASRSARPTRAPTTDGRPVQRPRVTMTTANATTARPVHKPASPATAPASPSGPPSAVVTTHPASPVRAETHRQPPAQIAPPQAHRVELERRVVAPRPPQPSRATTPPAAAPAMRPQPTRPATEMPRGPAPPPQTAPRAFTSPATAVLTGADLSAWRAARGLTQRPAADLLGVAPSTVAKAELLPGKVLGEQLQVALAAALAR